MMITRMRLTRVPRIPRIRSLSIINLLLSKNSLFSVNNQFIISKPVHAQLLAHLLDPKIIIEKQFIISK